MLRLYRRAKRLHQASDQIADRWLRTEADVDKWRTLLAMVAELPDAELFRRHQQLKTDKPGLTSRNNPWFVWTGPKGEQIWVGANELGNRRLSFQRARGFDVWMHIRGRPGAHVVIRLNKGKEPNTELLMAGAQVVLVHAKVANGTHHDVQWTHARHVRSLPGSSGAKVQILNERVLHVTRDPTALSGWSRSR